VKSHSLTPFNSPSLSESERGTREKRFIKLPLSFSKERGRK